MEILSESSESKRQFSVQPYISLTKSFGFSSHDEELWWNKSAPLLTRIMESAKYSVHQQYQFLTLYKTLMVPYLGPFQHTWQCSITHSGIPVEFSVNYQEHGKTTVRIAFEPVSSLSGTIRDQYNLNTVNDAVSYMARLRLPGFESQPFTALMRSLTLAPDEVEALNGSKLPSSPFKSQAAFGLDFKGDQVMVKSYLYPALKAHFQGRSFRQLIDEAIRSNENTAGYVEAVDLVSEYMVLGNCYNQYSFVGLDLVTPPSSRLKIYGALIGISWNKVAEIWTLGGRLAGNKDNRKGLDLLKKLWDFLTPTGHDRPVGIWNYEMYPNSLRIDPKFYIDMNGEDDCAKVTGIQRFFEYLGWNDAARDYRKVIQSYFPEANIDETTNLIQYVSFTWTEERGPYMSIYYHSRV